MSEEDRAQRLRDEAMLVQTSEPRRALDLLWTAVQQYPRTSTVRDRIIDDIIATARYAGFWDDATRACALAERVKPDFREHYSAEAKACMLDKEGRHIDATEVRLIKASGWYGDLLRFGDEFARLGAHDRAWRVYNQAIAVASKDGVSPHTVRQAMARLLLKEEKPGRAVEVLISGISEAHMIKGKVPKNLAVDLRKALRAAGFDLRSEQFCGIDQEIIRVCETDGLRQALMCFQARLEELRSLK